MFIQILFPFLLSTFESEVAKTVNVFLACSKSAKIKLMIFMFQAGEASNSCGQSVLGKNGAPLRKLNALYVCKAVYNYMDWIHVG
jgi:hypothetical protein